MKVSELKQLLDNFNDDDSVVIPINSDGDFSPIEEISIGQFSGDSWTGTFVEEGNEDESDETVFSNSESAICLWPKN